MSDTPEAVPKKRRKTLFAKAWTTEELIYLRRNYRKKSDAEIAVALQRTTLAVFQRRHKLKLDRMQGGMHGCYTLKDAIKETGYADVQILRARDTLKQKWRRVKGALVEANVPRPFLITEAQLKEITDFLGKEWGPNVLGLTGCLKCKSTERPHLARGLCVRCYAAEQKRFYAGRPSFLDSAPMATPSKVKLVRTTTEVPGEDQRNDNAATEAA